MKLCSNNLYDQVANFCRCGGADMTVAMALLAVALLAGSPADAGDGVGDSRPIESVVNTLRMSIPDPRYWDRDMMVGKTEYLEDNYGRNGVLFLQRWHQATTPLWRIDALQRCIDESKNPGLSIYLRVSDLNVHIQSRETKGSSGVYLFSDLLPPQTADVFVN